LGESHREELVPTGEATHSTFALVSLDDLTELMAWHEVHQLRKDGSTKMHAIVSEKVTVRKEKVTGKIRRI
jgi:hypothetical protein